MYYPVMSKIIRHKWSISLPKSVVSEVCLHTNLNLNCSRIKLWGGNAGEMTCLSLALLQNGSGMLWWR